MPSPGVGRLKLLLMTGCLRYASLAAKKDPMATRDLLLPLNLFEAVPARLLLLWFCVQSKRQETREVPSSPFPFLQQCFVRLQPSQQLRATVSFWEADLLHWKPPPTWWRYDTSTIIISRHLLVLLMLPDLNPLWYQKRGERVRERVM